MTRRDIVSLTNGVTVEIDPEDLGGELQYAGDDNIGKVLNAIFSHQPMDSDYHYPSIVAHIELEAATRLSKLVAQIAKDAEDELQAAKEADRTPESGS